MMDTQEGRRLARNREHVGHWNRWGPYLSERAWGTVREDYSAEGDAWDYFPHDHARSKAYRWNEDGLGGLCDRHQYLCFALALWNGRDPILKERMFGLTNREGNHGEDVKEYFFFLDGTPTHSYMKFLYKYPQSAYPYRQLLDMNASRTRLEREYELIDTGIFDAGRYFDVQIEYAKKAPEDVLVCIGISNRGPEPAEIWALPTLWFRNTWSWGRDARKPLVSEPSANFTTAGPERSMLAEHWSLGRYALDCLEPDDLLFTENETNTQRLYGSPASTPYVKDAFHRYIVDGERGAVNPARSGTKAAAVYRRSVPAGATVLVKLRLRGLAPGDGSGPPFDDFDAVFAQRAAEADEFYGAVIPASLPDDAKNIARQAFAGQLWSKQFYHYVVEDWLQGDPGMPSPPPQRLRGRNANWTHVFCQDVIAMPDTWEFPWFASWDLGFHCVNLALIDPQFAKEQIVLMLREWYMDENGQVPAYEWNFSDVNPPVLALAALRLFALEQARGEGDYRFLEQVFHKMLIAFTWWANCKDALGNDIFQGGFLGLDNIGALDRDNLPPGYLLGQADGTAWMATFSKSLFEMALLLAERDSAYEAVASKFWEHFIYIANAFNGLHSPASLWDERDGFFYDALLHPDGRREVVRARTIVGFVPLFESVLLPRETLDKFPAFERRRRWFIEHRPSLVDSVGPMTQQDRRGHELLRVVRTDQLVRMLAYLFDENEFFSPCGIRSVSRYHRDHPYIINLEGREYRLDYEPGESTTDLFGGNSNWRGPVWMPLNYLILEALDHDYEYFGDTFRMECPSGSGRTASMREAAVELARRLSSIFLRDADGRRPVNGGRDLFDRDPHWRDLIPFYEYFDGESGRGCGAGHQTGWTGLIATILIRFGPRFLWDAKEHAGGA